MDGKIAIVSDIHANKYALHEFLKFIDEERIKCVLNLGDFLQIGPNPSEVLSVILNDTRFINILGNNETSLFEIDESNQSEENLHRIWTRNKINDNFERVKLLTNYKIIEKNDIKILMIHSRINDMEGMPLFYINNLDAFAKDYEEYSTDVVLFGHTHEKFYLEHDNKIYINPGSLGCSKNGTVDFCVLEIEKNKILDCNFKSIEYNKSELIKDYYRNDIPDKEFILKTFFYYSNGDK